MSEVYSEFTKWKWAEEMIDEEYIPYLNDEDKEQYNIPHVDEIQQAKMEDEAELQEFLKAEAQLERGS